MPGLEPDDPDYLPGLEPDEPEAEAEAEPSAAPPRAEATPAAEPGEAAPERWGTGEWTNAELDSWYEAYGGDAQYYEDLNAGRIPREIYKDIGERYEDMEDLDPNVEPGTRGVSVPDALLSEAFLSNESRFSRLRPVTKAWLREHVEGRDKPPPDESDRLYEFGRTPEWKPIPDPADPAPGEPSEAGWNSPADLVYVTLPDGSEATLEVDKEAGLQRVISDDGSAGEWQPIEVIPDDLISRSTEPNSGAGSGLGGLKTMVIGGGAAVVAGVIAFLVLSGGGGGDSGPWLVTDPQNDFVPAFADKDAIANPSAAGDVTGLDVAVADGNTTVTVTFAGEAEGLMTAGGQELAAALQFIPVGDERWIDILFDEDGSVKISDAPSGSRITATWSAANVLVFEILGVTPASGATVRFATIQRDGFAHSTDEVSLATGGADAVVATAFVTDGGSSGGVASIPRAVLINPCDVIDRALAAELTGTTTEATSNRRGGSEQEACRYPAAEGGGVDLSISVVRNNNAGTVLNNWQERHENALEVRAVPWSGEGELRIGNADEEFPLTLLWAYVFERPEWDSDVYIQVEAYVIDGASISAAALTAGVETIGSLLNDALLEAQP